MKDVDELLQRYDDGERNFSGIVFPPFSNLSGKVSCVANLQAALSVSDRAFYLCCVVDRSGDHALHLGSLPPPPSGFEEADLNWANLKQSFLFESNLQEANVQNANLEGADLSGAGLGKTNLAEAQLIGASLKNANLAGANLRARI